MRLRQATKILDRQAEGEHEYRSSTFRSAYARWRQTDGARGTERRLKELLRLVQAARPGVRGTERQFMTMASVQSRLTGSMSPRPREVEPDPTTPNGQWALYLRHLMGDMSAADLAREIHMSRTSVFKWLRGDVIPPLNVWAQIARTLHLPGWESLAPTAEFLAGLPKRKPRKA